MGPGNAMRGGWCGANNDAPRKDTPYAVASGSRTSRATGRGDSSRCPLRQEDASRLPTAAATTPPSAMCSASATGGTACARGSEKNGLLSSEHGHRAVATTGRVTTSTTCGMAAIQQHATTCYPCHPLYMASSTRRTRHATDARGNGIWWAPPGPTWTKQMQTLLEELSRDHYSTARTATLCSSTWHSPTDLIHCWMRFTKPIRCTFDRSPGPSRSFCNVR